MTTPGRNLVQIKATATQAARLPALGRLREGDWAGLIRWADSVSERLEVRQGSRGNRWEKTVTFRDLKDMGLEQIVMTVGASAGNTVLTRGSDGKIQLVPLKDLLKQFADQLYTTKVYKDIQKDIDDPTRFDGLPAKVKALLLPDLNEIAVARGADVQRFEQKLQSAQESFASQTTEVTASFARNSAAVRQTLFAYANDIEATAGQVTTITSRLDDFGGSGATVEVAATTLASRSTGLEAQYTIKVAAGGAMAGIGLASTTSAEGNATSAVIIRADRFAVVGSGYSGGQTTTPSAGNIPFGIDTGTGNVYMSGNLLVGGTISSSAININSGQFTVNGTSGAVVCYNLIGYNSVFDNTANPGAPAARCAGNTISNTESFQSTSTSSNAGAHGIRGANSSYGTSGLVGMAGAYDFYADGGGTNYGPFTGAHDGLVVNGTPLEPGDLLVDVECVARRGVSNTLFLVEPSTTPNFAGAIGVHAVVQGALGDRQPAAMVDGVWYDGDHNAMPLMCGAYYELADTHTLIAFNAVGEGQLNVCGEGGDLSRGDLIVTSSMPGKGMRQADDIVRNYTVARAREAVSFDHADQVKQVACIYLCG